MAPLTAQRRPLDAAILRGRRTVLEGAPSAAGVVAVAAGRLPAGAFAASPVAVVVQRARRRIVAPCPLLGALPPPFLHHLLVLPLDASAPLPELGAVRRPGVGAPRIALAVVGSLRRPDSPRCAVVSLGPRPQKLRERRRRRPLPSSSTWRRVRDDRAREHRAAATSPRFSAIDAEASRRLGVSRVLWGPAAIVSRPRSTASVAHGVQIAGDGGGAAGATDDDRDSAYGSCGRGLSNDDGGHRSGKANCGAHHRRPSDAAARCELRDERDGPHSGGETQRARRRHRRSAAAPGSITRRGCRARRHESRRAVARKCMAMVSCGPSRSRGVLQITGFGHITYARYLHFFYQIDR